MHWCLILHAHLPWVRAEQPGSLEEDWLFEALTEVYLPLVGMLDRLEADTVPARLGLSLSGTLLGLLQDPIARERYDDYLDRRERVLRGERDRLSRGARELLPAAEAQLAAVTAAAAEFRQRCRSDLLASLRRHRDAGTLEVLASAATHAYLPLLLGQPSTVRAQVEVGLEAHRSAFGVAPPGFWLPECGYEPGLEGHLHAAGVRYVIVDAHGLLDGRPAPSRGALAPVVSPGGLAFFARDTASARQVWSAAEGYPGDGAYLEFHRDAGFESPLAILEPLLRGGGRRAVGIRYHRVTTRDLPLAAKEPYDPERARARVAEHAEHFVSSLEKRAGTREPGAAPPVVVSPYDAELFGHWWHEGMPFLEGVLRALASRGGPVEPATPGGLLEMDPLCEVVQPAASSWGEGGYSGVWLDSRNDWMLPRLQEAGERMIGLTRAHPEATGLTRRGLDQAARELLLAQSSDWPFMLRTGNAADYARRRFRAHLERFGRLEAGLAHGRLEESAVAALEALDGVFPELDYRVYR